MAKKWYEEIIDKVKNVDENIIFVIDKADLFSFQEFEAAISKYFSNIIFYESELKLRKSLKEINDKALIIIKENQRLAHDFEKKYHLIEVNYKDICPNLNSNALQWLNNYELQELYLSYKKNIKSYEFLNFKESINFILKELYNTDSYLLSKESMISFLIKYYFLNDHLKSSIYDYLEDKLINLNLKIEKLNNKEKFYKWLNKKWREFIFSGNSEIDFNHLKLRYLLMDCFDQGLLKQIDVIEEKIDIDTLISKGAENYWINAGLKNYKKIDLLKSINNDREYLKELLNRKLGVKDWGRVARIWSDLIYRKAENNLSVDFNDLLEIMDQKFYEFIELNYNNLVYDHRFQYAPLNNRILPRVLDNTNKIAIICIDGMSFKEWPILEKYLVDKLNITFKTSFTISTIPSVTKFARRAIFSGKLPFEDDFKGNEEKLFTEYLVDNTDINKEEIYFQRENNPENKNFIGYQAVGLIYNFVDNLAHSAQSQTMLINNIKENLNTNNLDNVIKELLINKFNIYFTSDHGNIFAEGNNFNPQKSLIDEKASRALIYDNYNLAKNEEFEDKKIFKFPNILGDKYVVTMLNRKKFGGRDAGFTHGGINIEELIIPFAEVIQ